MTQDAASSSVHDLIAAAILGHAVGDALGVPVEFKSRYELREEPVVGMRAFGTHQQPAGTWSDDTSLLLCLVESICECGWNLRDQGERFVRWCDKAYWTPHGKVFDIGIATYRAISRLATGTAPLEAGPCEESSNGNGSLMRMLPVALYFAYATPEERVQRARECSRLTHGHDRSQWACAMYVEIAAGLVRGLSLQQAFVASQAMLRPLLEPQCPSELMSFERLLSPGLPGIREIEIFSSGYVIHCLEASLWCALRASSFADGVLQAVNLGDDTDTTGAVTGGLLGLTFGRRAIPSEWIAAIARHQEIALLCRRFATACEARWAQDLASGR